jgi:hypothetical protein
MIQNHMRSKIISIRFTLLLFYFIISIQILFAQGTDSRYGQQPHFYLGFNICPSQTEIMNKGTITISSLSATKRNSLFGSIEAGYFFSRSYGLGIGFGYSSFGTDLSLKSYSVSYDTTDSELESYERQIMGEDINEIQKISYLNIPLLMNIQISVNKKFGFFLQTGMNFSFVLSKQYSSSGKFTYSGYYPAYNVIIKDIPYEGFQSNVLSNVEGKLNIKSLNPELITSIGFFLTFQNKFQISLGILYNRSLTNLSNVASTDSFILSSAPNHIRSMMEGSTNVIASSKGIRLSFRYYISKP